MAEAKETIDQIWSGDLLGRRNDGEYLLRFLTGRARDYGGPFVLNIDAGWGQGKTDFLTRLGRHLALEGHIVAKVDAWASDHASDPLLAVMAALEDAIRPWLQKPGIKDRMDRVKSSAGAIAWAATKGAGGQIGRKYFGEALDTLLDAVGTPQPDKGDGKGAKREAGIAAVDSAMSEIEAIADRAASAALDTFRRGERSIVDFRRNLSDVIKQAHQAAVPSPMFVLIDELDRCRPSYAIELLERTKHLFNVESVTFILATDTAQMQESIKAIYGQGFDSPRYLHRFFDRTYRFNPPALEAFLEVTALAQPIAEAKLTGLPDRPTLKLMGEIFDNAGLSLRDIKQCYDLLATIAAVWDRPFPIELTVMLPMIICQHYGLNVSDNGVSQIALEKRFDPSAQTLVMRSRSGEEKVTPFAAMQTGFDMALRPESYVDESFEAQPLHRYYRNQLLNEMANTGYANRSAIRDYPSIVRMAGRLAAG